MPALPADTLPELLRPRGYVPAVEPVPASAEVLPESWFEGETEVGPGRAEALLPRILATASAARARMDYAAADAHLAAGMRLAAQLADAAEWSRRFAAERFATRLFAADSLSPDSAEMDGILRVTGASDDAPADDGTERDDPRTAINRALASALAGEVDAAREMLDRAEAAIAPADAHLQLGVMINRTQLLLESGDLRAAIDLSADALRAARREKLDPWIALAGLSAGLVHLARGRRNEARARFADAVRLFAKGGDVLRQIQCHYLLGEVAYVGEDPIRAGAHYRDALALARPAGAGEWIELLTLRFEHR